jgi:hypothetical protein
MLDFYSYKCFINIYISNNRLIIVLTYTLEECKDFLRFSTLYLVELLELLESPPIWVFFFNDAITPLKSSYGLKLWGESALQCP